MPVIAPVPISTLPTPPTITDPVNFDTRADAFVIALPVLQAETNTISNVNYNNALIAETSATSASVAAASAANSVVAAAAAAGATIWVSGTSYIIGDVRYSPTNVQVYRRITNGSGTIEPMLDKVNWAPVLIQPASAAIFLANYFGGF